MVNSCQVRFVQTLHRCCHRSDHVTAMDMLSKLAPQGEGLLHHISCIGRGSRQKNLQEERAGGQETKFSVLRRGHSAPNNSQPDSQPSPELLPRPAQISTTRAFVKRIEAAKVTEARHAEWLRVAGVGPVCFLNWPGSLPRFRRPPCKGSRLALHFPATLQAPCLSHGRAVSCLSAVASAARRRAESSLHLSIYFCCAIWRGSAILESWPQRGLHQGANRAQPELAVQTSGESIKSHKPDGS